MSTNPDTFAGNMSPLTMVTFKCVVCKGKLQGGAAGDAVRHPRGGYRHRGSCDDWKPAPVAKLALAPSRKPPKSAQGSRRDVRKNRVRSSPRARKPRERAKPELRTCAFPPCAEKFEPRKGHQRFCCPKHREQDHSRDKGKQRRDAEKKKAQRTAARAGRTCLMEGCGVDLSDRNGNSLYCGRRHREQVQWRRRKQRESPGGHDRPAGP